MYWKSENYLRGSKHSGCKAWAMTEQTKASYKTWQRKILINVYSTITHKNGWRIRTDDGLQVMWTKPNIVTKIKGSRLELVGHVVRMPDDRTAKKVFLGKPDGRKIRGRPIWRMIWNRWVPRDGERQQDRDPHGYHPDGGAGYTVRTVCQWISVEACSSTFITAERIDCTMHSALTLDQTQSDAHWY
jgi:hypothetical protein